MIIPLTILCLVVSFLCLWLIKPMLVYKRLNIDLIVFMLVFITITLFWIIISELIG